MNDFELVKNNVCQMIEYLCRRDSLEKVPEINKYKGVMSAELLYPASTELIYALIHDDSLKKEALANAEPEFLKYNIVEGEIENVY